MCSRVAGAACLTTTGFGTPATSACRWPERENSRNGPTGTNEGGAVVADKPKDNGPCKACHGRGGVMTVLPDKNGKLRRGWLQCTVCSGTGRDPGY
jgi:hypothetical protein